MISLTILMDLVHNHENNKHLNKNEDHIRHTCHEINSFPTSNTLIKRTALTWG